MKYLIYDNGMLQKVKRCIYEQWINKWCGFYNLPEYIIIIDEKLYSLETVYAGAVDDDDATRRRVDATRSDTRRWRDTSVPRDRVAQHKEVERLDDADVFGAFGDFYGVCACV